MPSTTSSDDLCGSGQSLESIAKDKAAQPALFAAAAKRVGKARVATPDKPKSTISKGTLGLTKAGKRVFVIHKPDGAPDSGSSSTSRRGKYKHLPAKLEFHRAKYQKGDKSGKYSGTVYAWKRPRRGNNDTFKTKVNPKLLKGPTRWNDAVKFFTATVHTVEEAIMVREAMKMVSEEDEKDLLETAPTDEDIEEIFNFPEAKDTTISIISEVDIDGEPMMALAGFTYPFKDDIKEVGFNFYGANNMWIAPVGTDISELEEKFHLYGFNVENFDEAASTSDMEDA